MPVLLLALVGTFATAQDVSHSPGWVVISVDDYRDLRAKAYPSEARPEPLSVEATLTRVDYDLKIDGDAATGQANLTVDVVKDGWVRVPIPHGLLVRAAHLEGKLVSLALGPGNGSELSALLSRPGRAVLVLDIAVPVTSAAASESLSLPATASGITRATMQISRPEVDLAIAGGLLTEKGEQSHETRWTAYGHGTEPLTFTWRRRTEDHRSSLPLRQRGSLIELVSLGEDSTAITAEIDLEILQGTAQEEKLQLGDNISINQVSGATVSDWEIKNGELTVKLLEPADHSVRFVVNCETRLPRDGQIAVPIFAVESNLRQTGGIAVEVLGAGEIKDVKAQGLEEADATDLGAMVASRQSPSLAAYRFRNVEAGPRSLAVEVARYTQQAVLMANVEEARYRALFSNDGKMLVQARYAVRNNQRNFLKITLPPGAMVWSAALSGKAIRPGQSPDGSILLPLEKARGGEDASEFAVEFVYFSRGPKWEDKGKVVVQLPALDLPVSRTGLLLYYPPLFKLSAEPGVFREQTYAAPVSDVLTTLSTDAVTGSGTGEGVQGLVQSNDLSANNRDDETRRKAAFFAKTQGVRARGILPIRVSFPAFGPSVFLTAQLTSVSQAASATFNYQQDKKGGRR
ncbi:MAG TPA: hypothetical protein VL156_05640 [Terriglobales bacterium]|nr:hypothetical protein [Terriglobales bacterium]